MCWIEDDEEKIEEERKTLMMTDPERFEAMFPGERNTFWDKVIDSDGNENWEVY